MTNKDMFVFSFFFLSFLFFSYFRISFYCFTHMRLDGFSENETEGVIPLVFGHERSEKAHRFIAR